MLSNKYNNNFNLIRHVAACMVVYAHCIVPGQVEFFNDITNSRLELSSLGVEIFFIISGYLVTRSLLHSASRWQFARKRWLRIWPALFAVTFVLCFVLGPALTQLPIGGYIKSPQTWLFFFRNSVFLPIFTLPGVFTGYAVNATYWTIFFEVLCYLGLFIVGKQLVIKWRWGFLIVWFLLAIWKFLIPFHALIPAGLAAYKYGIEDMMFLFFSGSLWHLFANDRKLPGVALYLPALLIFVITVAFSFSCSKFLRYLSLVIFIIEWGKCKAIIHWPSWDVSYGVYLIGWPVEMLLINQYGCFETTSTRLFLGTMAITLPLAFASWYCIERPALQKK